MEKIDVELDRGLVVPTHPPIMYDDPQFLEGCHTNTGQWLKTIWRAKFGAPNHGFDTYVYALAALEILADDICRNEIGLKALDMGVFWRYAKQNLIPGEK